MANSRTPGHRRGRRWGAGDCNDANAAIRPGATETPNGVDDDCDGTIDEGTTAYDDDGDGYSEAGGDCNDASTAVRPGATEVLNGVDDDCDGHVDEGSNAFDDDGDGYSENAGDCNDADATRNPGEPELLNGRDDDCDGQIDEGATNPACSGGLLLGNYSGPATAVAFSTLTGRAGQTNFVYDRYVSNPQPSAGAVNNNTVRSFAGTGVFTGFSNPVTTYTTYGLQTAVGVRVYDQVGNGVVFWDGTSSVATSDVAGCVSGAACVCKSVIFTFVNPSNPSQDAVVSSVGFIVGSTAAGVYIELLDIYGDQIVIQGSGDAVQAPVVVNAASLGYETRVGGVLTPMIHQLRFTSTGSDPWLIGSFTGTNTSIDMTYGGLTVP